MGEMKNAHNLLDGKPEGKRLFKRPSIDLHYYCIKLDIWEMGWESTDWINLVQNKDQRQAVVNKAMNFYFAKMMVNFLTSLAFKKESASQSN